MSTKCLTTIPQGSRPQAIGGRNAKGPEMDRDIVSSAWRHAAAIELAGVGVASTLKIMSADWILGVPFNILAYYLLLRVVSTYLNMEMGGIKYTFNDVHLYEDHIDQANEIYPRCTHRPPRLHFQPFPMLPREEGLAMWRAMDTRAAINALQMDWFTLDSALNYISLPKMKANVAV